MSAFRFVGEIPASKSIFNRALLISSFFPELKIFGDSNCDDVVHMKAAVKAFAAGEPMNCGEAGTAFRFMAARVSREAGDFFLHGTPRLLQRPQQELALILSQLGVEVALEKEGVRIQGKGWQQPSNPLRVPRTRSSQFASAFLLSSWNLPFDLEIEFEGNPISEGYLQMTKVIVQALGMQVLETGTTCVMIPKGQTLKATELRVEPDYSSLFAVAAAALVAGVIEVPYVGPRSLQPDFIFIEHLRSMRAEVRIESGVLKCSRAKRLQSLNASLRESPDLFPVLAALCSFADGTSHLSAAPQLAHKESDRLRKTKELLSLAGIASRIENEGLVIEGRGMDFQPSLFRFDPDQDHRMAMAASLFQLREPGIQVTSPEVVSKSYPDFWKVLGLIV